MKYTLRSVSVAYEVETFSEVCSGVEVWLVSVCPAAVSSEGQLKCSHLA